MRVQNFVRRQARWVLAALLVSAASGLAVPTPAMASCAGPPSPSPYRFTGTIISVHRDGLIANVRTDDGRDVVVRGTPPDNDTGFTSVDRRFTPGLRYEFHPVNNTSPYEDNACTATTAIGGTPVQGSGNVSGRESSTSDGGVGGWIIVAAVLMTVLGVAAVLVLRHRRLTAARREHAPIIH